MKQLEIEYKNAISLEVPDLWNRIEAGIDEYEATKKTDNISYIKEETKNEEKTNRVSSKKVIAYIGRISAAAVCLILAIGAFNLMRGSKNTAEMATSDATATADFAASEASDEAPAVAEYAAEAEAEEYSDTYEMDEATAPSEAGESAIQNAEGSSGKDTLSYKNGFRSDSEALTNEAVADPNGIESLMSAVKCDRDHAMKILLNLSLAGIDHPSDFAEAAQEIKDIDEVKLLSGYGDDTLRISFTDNEAKEYLMYCNKNTDDTIDILAIVRADDSAEMIYRKEK